MISRKRLAPLTLAIGVTIVGVIGVGVLAMQPRCPPILQALSWIVAMTALPGTVAYLPT